jgi:hypothetical protein
MIATPMHGGQCHGQYTFSLLGFYTKMLELNWKWDVQFIFNESLITRARDDLATLFLASNCTHLMFIDADIKFDPNHIVKMIEADKDIIGGVYPMKSINWASIRAAVEQGTPNEFLPLASSTFVLHAVNETDRLVLGHEDPIEVTNIGTGMMLIKRDVFEKMKSHVPTYINDNLGPFMGKEVHQFFNTGVDPETNRLMPEDYNFCKAWRAVGGKVYAAPWAIGLHIGQHTFGA